MKKLLFLFLSVFFLPSLSFGAINPYIPTGFDIDEPILWHPKAVQFALEDMDISAEKFSFLINVYAKVTSNNTQRLSIYDMSYLWLKSFQDECPMEKEECQARAIDFASKVIAEHNKLVIESRNQLKGDSLTEEEANKLFEHFFSFYCEPRMMPLRDRRNVTITKKESTCKLISPDLKNTFECEMSVYYSNSAKCILTCPEVIYEDNADAGNIRADSNGCSTKLAPAN